MKTNGSKNKLENVLSHSVISYMARFVTIQEEQIYELMSGEAGLNQHFKGKLIDKNVIERFAAPYEFLLENDCVGVSLVDVPRFKYKPFRINAEIEDEES